MALTAVQPAMDLERKKDLHPFFSKPPLNPPVERQVTSFECQADSSQDALDYKQSEQTAEARKKRTRKPNGAEDKIDTGRPKNHQPSLDVFTPRPNDLDVRSGATVPAAGNAANGEIFALSESSSPIRKKRETSPSPNLAGGGAALKSAATAMTWHQQLRIEAGMDKKEPLERSSYVLDEQQHTENNIGAESMIKTHTEADLIPQSSDHADCSPTVEPAPEKIPRKMLKVTKTGKLLSSPSSSKQGFHQRSSPRRRRERKLSKKGPYRAVVVMRYGSDSERRLAVGQKIDDILNGKKVPMLQQATPRKATEPVRPPKETHPFFLGKPAQKEEVTNKTSTGIQGLYPPKSPRKSAVTPGKLKAESMTYQSSRPTKIVQTIDGSSHTIKVPGMCEAPWPSQETMHVRNLTITQPAEGSFRLTPRIELLRKRKMKGNPPVLSQSEDIVNKLTRHLGSLACHDSEETEFKRTGHVRFPNRLLTTGFDIQEQVRHQLGVSFTGAGREDANEAIIHPAVHTMFEDIEQNMTPFDEGKCETQLWVQKYCPTQASHVLQAGKEALVLRDWLQNLTVAAVESRMDCSMTSNPLVSQKPPMKKRKKNEDDFIVDIGEEEDDMVELSENNEYGPYDWGLPRPVSLTRIHASRNKNVIIISGPKGCGKSATVHAVAKELGFEVFEINSGSRRSGKDIQDRVGDMSENHLVSVKKSDTESKSNQLPIDEIDVEHSKTFQDDLESGRQGTMTAFFKPTVHAQTVKVQTRPHSKESKKITSASHAMKPCAKTTRKPQKQSLILFEEADVLFEEDQQFWTQVTKLASQSKRPIIITCNDESLVPVYDMPLGAILRLSPPPVSLAVDYLLCLAAKEGHILRRDAVCDLFKSKDHDLRASITELNFWCQMSVGDRKGGLEWIYQRWPPGKDTDEYGRTIRVASQGTYQSGMGMLSYDVATSEYNIGCTQESELLQEAWTNWALRPDDLIQHTSFRKTFSTPLSEPLQDLKCLDDMLESISSADIYCRVGLPSYDRCFQEPTDPAVPPLPDKERSNYTAEAHVVQCDHRTDFSAMDTDIFIQSHMSIQRAFSGKMLRADGVNVPSISLSNDVTKAILKHVHDSQCHNILSWPIFSEAFDILASPTARTIGPITSYHLTSSTFDRTFKIVVEDLSPYVRSIVANELRLETERLRLSNLLSVGGRAKRPRTTRASRTALEGGTRQTKRKERWFDKDLNRALVMRTAGSGWAGLGSRSEHGEVESQSAESAVSSPEGYLQ